MLKFCFKYICFSILLTICTEEGRNLSVYSISSKCSQDVIFTVRTIKLWHLNKYWYLRTHARHRFRKNGDFENLCLHFWIFTPRKKDLSNHKSPRSFKTLIWKINLYSITSLLYQCCTHAALAVMEFWKCMVCLDNAFKCHKNNDIEFFRTPFQTKLWYR